MKLSELSLLCLSGTIVLGNFTPDEGFLVAMPLWIQWLLMSLLVIVPGLGVVAGVMSWRREGRTGCLASAVMGMNIIFILLGAFRMYVFSSPG